MPQGAGEQPKAGAAADGFDPSAKKDSPAGAPVTESEDRQNGLNSSLVKHMATDQKEIWTSPIRLRPLDAAWFVPVAGVAAALFSTDREFSRSLSNSSSRLNNSQSLSNYGVAALGGIGGGLYLWGKFKSDDHKVETAILSGEAALSSFLVVEGLKYAAGRDRPLEGGGGGRFFQGGSSFPSAHSAVAWSIAGMFTHEYPGPLTSLFAYGLATTVSLSRVTAKQHFPSDVFVAGVFGWWISRQTYRAHHNSTVGGTSWETYAEAHEGERRRRAPSLGSTYVPLESWVYPAFERLAAMGYVPITQFSIKPWTRVECAALTEQVGDKLTAALQRDAHPQEEAVRLETALRAEFARELAALEAGTNQSLQLQSAYARVTSISGPPLTDGFHFGQTTSYDYGRADRQGTNAIVGTEIRGTEGPFAFFVQTEYQHAPSAPSLSLAARTVIANVDNSPLQSAVPFAPVNRVDVLQGYMAYGFKDYQLTVGKQTLSWGPSTNAPLTFGSNAEPFPMIRLTRMQPFRLPGFLKYLAPVRVDNIFGRLEGHTKFPRPFIFAQRATMDLGPYLEFSYSRYTIWGGQGGDPVTIKSFGEVFFGRACTIPSCAGKGAPPGESATASDITFRVPKTHGSVLLYVDLYSEDDAMPWGALREDIYRPGLYFARLPWLSKLDLRIEAVNSQAPFLVQRFPNSPGFNYTDGRYTNGFTTDGFLMGNTVGREGQALQASSTYWFAPQKSLRLSYKNSLVDPHFIPQGGKWQDYGIQYEALQRSGLYVKGSFQFEHISSYLLLFQGSVNNVAASIQLGFSPTGGFGWPKRGERLTRTGDAGPN